MLYAAPVLSIYARARIRGIDTSAALASPNVVAVFTAADLPEAARDDEAADRSQFFLASERVAYVGQPIAVVVAGNAADAELAADRVTVDYEPLAPVIDLEAAMAPDAVPVRSRRAFHSQEAGAHGADPVANQLKDGRPNVNGALHNSRGDVERAFREADVVVRRTFRTHAIHQSYMEPRAAVAAPDPFGGVTIYAQTQGQFMLQSAVAAALGLSDNQVRVEPITVGGGFGAKFTLLEPLAAVLALKLNRPVKLTLNRRDDFPATTPAPESIVEMAIAATSDGTFTGFQARLIFDTGFFSHSPYVLVAQSAGSYYRFPNLDVTSLEILSNRTGAGAYRAPGLPQAVFALETLVDEVAERLGMSPIELRLKNVVDEGDPMADGTPWGPLDWRRVLRELADSPLLSTPRGDGEGVGIAIGGMRGGVEPASATMRLNTDGTLQVIVGSIDLTGTTTGLTQIAAEAFGVPPERVRVTTAGTATAPQSPSTGGSRILFTVGNAVIEAAREARTQALAAAADKLEVGIDDLEIVDDRIVVRGAPDRFIRLADVYAATMVQGSTYTPVFGKGSVANPHRAPAVSAHLVRVKVDRDTGQVRVTDYVAVHDVGRAINPAEVEAQIHGAVVQGIGWGLFEEMVYDDNGQLLTSSFMDYAIPKADRVPAIETRIIENPSPHGPYGAKGIAEAPVVAPAAAIANAIADATGVRLAELPMTPQRVWQALRDAERG
jgi:CO/xanthine dehydrogenase Mo-binding subunit